MQTRFFLTSLFLLPWAFKPLFAPILETFYSKKNYTVFFQGIIAILFFVLAFITHDFPLSTIAAFAIIALVGTCHDITADGLYLNQLEEKAQKQYVGLRTAFYHMGRLVVKGGLFMGLGALVHYFHFDFWQAFFLCLALVCTLLVVHHWKYIIDRETSIAPLSLQSLKDTLLGSKVPIRTLVFIFSFNALDAQMQKILPLFLLDHTTVHLSLNQLGLLFGMVGTSSFVLGTGVASWLLSRYALVDCLKIGSVGYFMLEIVLLGNMLISMSVKNAIVLVIGHQLLTGISNGFFMSHILVKASHSQNPMTQYALFTAAMTLGYACFGMLSALAMYALPYSSLFIYLILIQACILLFTLQKGVEHA